MSNYQEILSLKYTLLINISIKHKHKTKERKKILIKEIIKKHNNNEIRNPVNFFLTTIKTRFLKIFVPIQKKKKIKQN